MDDVLYLTEGLIYHKPLNKFLFTNEFVMNSGLNFIDTARTLGAYAEYISDDPRDILYSRTQRVPVFNEKPNILDKTLLSNVDLSDEIRKLKEGFPQYCSDIDEEFTHIHGNPHNELLLCIAVLLKRHLDKTTDGVFMMRGSGVSSFILHLMGLNRVNPLKYNLDYRDFWL